MWLYRTLLAMFTEKATASWLTSEWNRRSRVCKQGLCHLLCVKMLSSAFVTCDKRRTQLETVFRQFITETHVPYVLMVGLALIATSIHLEDI